MLSEGSIQRFESVVDVSMKTIDPDDEIGDEDTSPW